MKIEFNTDNAAFQEYGAEYQIEAILNGIARRIKNGETEGKIQDKMATILVNGPCNYTAK